LGTWWEQKDIDGLLMGTRGIWWELFGSLMGAKRIWWKLFWEQKDFDWLLMGTRGIWWELFGNLMRTKGFWWEIKPPPLQKDFKNPFAFWGHVCATQLAHPFKKNKNHPWRQGGATQLALLTCFILMCSHFLLGTSYQDRRCPCMEFVFNKLQRGQGEIIRWSS
jgi:hypothetical protein